MAPWNTFNPETSSPRNEEQTIVTQAEEDMKSSSTTLTAEEFITPDTIATSPSLATKPDDDDSRSIGNQTNVLTTRQLLIAFPALSVVLFVSFIDQTSVSTSIPVISSQLDTRTLTPWIGSSFLVASTAFQLINGRLSDIFGRKNCLLVCLALLGLGDLLCGFARNKEMLFAFRAMAGIGGGGVNSIAMIIVSDITTLENRGKFQGSPLLFLTHQPCPVLTYFGGQASWEL
jgi:Na+/melibiose symporter-like transporter